jgi:hypothetical protein
MPKNPELPKPKNIVIKKQSLLKGLAEIDDSPKARKRVLALESDFHKRISTHVAALPAGSSQFNKFNTSPFVLMFYAKRKGYHFVSQIEQDILPAKLFSSMETSAGRMVQSVVLPVYGWKSVESTMHSSKSVLDGLKKEGKILRVATLKSGPRCLNDEMSKDIADDIVAHAEEWANEAGVDHVEFSYAVLYGTPKQSNKKDWHILRNIVETVGTRFVTQLPNNAWSCSFRVRSVKVDVSVRLGLEWWQYLGGENTLIEILIALIRSCVSPTTNVQKNVQYVISDLADIVSTQKVPRDYNVGLLQRSQIEWLFFLARHYCDELD